MTAHADTADPVKDLCGQLAAYLPRLQALLSEPDSPAGYAATGKTGALAHSPLPGNTPAFLAATGIHGAARWAESLLLYHHGATDTRGRRGGSDANTLAALQAIVSLALGADDVTTGMVLRELSRCEADAGSVAAIDETQKWRRLRGHPCPYCGCFFLDVLLDRSGVSTGHVECHAVGCRDGDGGRPAGQVTFEGLEWADGRIDTPPSDD